MSMMRGTTTRRKRTKRKREEQKVESWRYERIIAALDTLNYDYIHEFQWHEMDDTCVEKCIDDLRTLDPYLSEIIPKAGHKLNFVLEFKKTKASRNEAPADEIKNENDRTEQKQQEEEKQQQEQKPSSSSPCPSSLGIEKDTVEEIVQQPDVTETETEKDDISHKTEEPESQIEIEDENQEAPPSPSPSSASSEVTTCPLDNASPVISKEREPEELMNVELEQMEMKMEQDSIVEDEEAEENEKEEEEHDDEEMGDVSSEIEILNTIPTPKLKELRVIVERVKIEPVPIPVQRSRSSRGRGRGGRGRRRRASCVKNLNESSKSEGESSPPSPDQDYFSVSTPDMTSPACKSQCTNISGSRTWRKILNGIEEGEKSDLDKVCFHIIAYLTFFYAERIPVKKEVAFSGWIVNDLKLERGLQRLQKKYKLITIHQPDNFIQLHAYPDPLLDLDVDFFMDMPIRDSWDSKLIYLGVKIGIPRQFQPLLSNMINSCIHILTDPELQEHTEEILDNFLLISKKSETGVKVVDLIPVYWDFLFQLAVKLMTVDRWNEAFPLFSRVAQICEREYGEKDEAVLLSKENMATIDILKNEQLTPME